MAVSVDGFIAGDNDETPWSDEEWAAYQDFIKTCDVCVIGRRTYEIMRDNDDFMAGQKYLVATSNRALNTGDCQKIVIKSRTDLPNVEKLGIIGGGELNGSLAKLGLIDEIILDIEPVILGGGKRLFGSHEIDLELTLRSSKPLGGATVQNHYMVN